MKAGIFRALLPLFLILPGALQAASPCLQGEGRAAEDWINALRERPGIAKDPQAATRIANSLDAWLRVNLRLATATGFAARIVICDVPTVNAYVSRRGEPIRVHGGTVDLLGSDEDLIAVVLAHEYSHLVLDHAAEKRAAATVIGARAARTYATAARQTWAAGNALETAKREFLTDFMAFNREQELKADDHGIALMSKVGFKPEAFTRLGLMLQSRGGDAQTTAFASHPGFLERLIRSDDRVTDETFDQSAAQLLRDDGPQAAEPLLRQWLARLPASGNALYYRALLLREKGSAKALEFMEEAFVAAQPTLKQKDQDIRDAWLWLCTTLYRQGYAVESANCAVSFFKRDRRLWEDYQRVAFPGGIWVGDGGSAPDPNLNFIRTEDGRRLITNDAAVARAHGVDPAQATPNWKPIRYRSPCGDIGQAGCDRSR